MDINLCKILKGHEGETFYSPLYGDVVVRLTTDTNYPIAITSKYGDTRILESNGKYGRGDGECLLFPSKDQRNWNKWDKENNHKTPKTWSELIKLKGTKEYALHCQIVDGAFYNEVSSSSIEQSALALLKIHQLIEVGYGGNITNEEWNDGKRKYVIVYVEYRFVINIALVTKRHIAFHTQEQAEEFLKYPENVQLLRDYFQIN